MGIFKWWCAFIWLDTLLLREVDHQLGLTEQLASTFKDQHHPYYIDHSLQILMAHRTNQIASSYENARCKSSAV